MQSSLETLLDLIARARGGSEKSPFAKASFSLSTKCPLCPVSQQLELDMGCGGKGRSFAEAVLCEQSLNNEMI